MTAGFKPDIKNHFNVVSGGDLDPAVRSARLQEKQDQENLNQAAMGGRDLEDLAYVPLKGTESFTALKEKEVLQNRKQKEKDSRLTQQIMRQANEIIAESFEAMAGLINDMYQGANNALDIMSEFDKLKEFYKACQERTQQAIETGDLEVLENGNVNNPLLMKMMQDYMNRNPEAKKPETKEEWLIMLRIQNAYVTNTILPWLDNGGKQAANSHDNWTSRAAEAEKREKVYKEKWKKIQEIDDPEERAKEEEALISVMEAQTQEDKRLNNENKAQDDELREDLTEFRKNGTVPEHELEAEMSNDESLRFSIGSPKPGFPSP